MDAWNLTIHHAYVVRRGRRWQRVENIPYHAPACWFRLRMCHLCVHIFVTFSVYNILTGILVEKATERVVPERDQVILDEHKKIVRMQ